MIYTEKNKSF